MHFLNLKGWAEPRFHYAWINGRNGRWVEFRRGRIRTGTERRYGGGPVVESMDDGWEYRDNPIPNSEIPAHYFRAVKGA